MNKNFIKIQKSLKSNLKAFPFSKMNSVNMSTLMDAQ